MTVSELKDELLGIIDDLDNYGPDDIVNAEKNTYWVSKPYLATREGFISLNDLDIEEYDYSDRDADLEESVKVKEYYENSVLANYSNEDLLDLYDDAMFNRYVLQNSEDEDAEIIDYVENNRAPKDATKKYPHFADLVDRIKYHYESGMQDQFFDAKSPDDVYI